MNGAGVIQDFNSIKKEAREPPFQILSKLLFRYRVALGF